MKLLTIQDDTHVGIGIYPFIINDPVLLPAAEWHDSAYTKGSWQQQYMTRKEVDERFLDLMDYCCTTRAQHMRAYTYYYVSRVLGRFFWEGKE